MDECIERCRLTFNINHDRTNLVQSITKIVQKRIGKSSKNTAIAHFWGLLKVGMVFALILLDSLIMI
jgi:hypothetical protein